jgi:hypothetical protein
MPAPPAGPGFGDLRQWRHFLRCGHLEQLPFL